ncbi:MAG: hypothetical protein GX444_08685 [Myxococcales bacterium]|nr:hypothetical protein [Myxococcales bacterium]
MSKDLIEKNDTGREAPRKFCPLLKETCRGQECQWWVLDYMEARHSYRIDCAITMMAVGLTDEALLKLAGRPD